MDLDDIVEIVDGDAALHQVAEVRKESRCPRDAGSGPDKAAGLRIDPDLGKPGPALRHVPERAGACRCRGREGDAPVGAGRGEGVVVAEAQRLRDALVVHDGVAAEDILGRHHTLPPGGRGEIGRADDVAGGVNVLHARAHLPVNDDCAVRAFAETLQRFRPGDEPGSKQDGIGLDLPAVGEEDRPDPSRTFDTRDRGPLADANPGKIAQNGRAHLRIEVPEQPVPGDDLNLGPECPEYMRELRCRHSAADNDHTPGEVGHRRKRPVGVDAEKIGAGDSGDCRPRPGGREDRIGPDFFIVDEGPTAFQMAFGPVDDLDTRRAGLGIEDRGEFLLDLTDPSPDHRIGDGRDRVEDAEVLLGPGVLDEPRDVV